MPFRLGRRLPPAPESPFTGPDWMQADPERIAGELAHARSLPSGGWFAVDDARAIRDQPRPYTIAGRELVLWRADRVLRAGPAACPHMGASLACARVEKGMLVCPWHGLRLGPKSIGGWSPGATYDDGVLAWVRFDEPGQKPTETPFLPPRPATSLSSVMRLEAACDPEDVIANRLDPWHGAHYHPHSFASLRVTDASDHVLSCRVAVRLLGPVALEVDCTFHCPDPRTIVMTITDGEGAGSVVETHATPLAAGRTAILEATLATSERRGFALAARAARLIQPAMAWAQRRLWIEDAAYAERRARLREQGFSDLSLDRRATAASPRQPNPTATRSAASARPPA